MFIGSVIWHQPAHKHWYTDGIHVVFQSFSVSNYYRITLSVGKDNVVRKSFVNSFFCLAHFPIFLRRSLFIWKYFCAISHLKFLNFLSFKLICKLQFTDWRSAITIKMGVNVWYSGHFNASLFAFYTFRSFSLSNTHSVTVVNR